MGIRFNTNTWRAPLQLIDCWLPVAHVHAPTPPLTLPRTLQKFVRAGWLNRAAAAPYPNTVAVQSPARACATVRNLDVHRRVLTSPAKTRTNPDTRLVLSGRMGEVCAELDRLAAIEMCAIR